jgi:hypothetical protein
MAATGAFAFTTTVGVVNWVHCHSAGLRAFTKPAIPASLTNFNFLKIQIANLSYGGTAILYNQTNFA